MAYKDPQKRREMSRQTSKKAHIKYKEKYREKYRETHLKWRRGNRKYLDRKKELYRINIVKQKARYTLANAVASGLIKRLPCQHCGEVKSEGHHEDYTKALVVIWLCKMCHNKHHQKVGFSKIGNLAPK